MDKELVKRLRDHFKAPDHVNDEEVMRLADTTISGGMIKLKLLWQRFLKAVFSA